ncbi:molybdenum cofactor guanylyltransferase [Bowmanella sp. Y26]|uniref:molybdenum cofactor guanylyltransferase n=1 Tax=Bowmanella yangjiangensis TaxID=2811230 RepID=UPI001BDC3258|nr:molybdenum cofactor guanylyltransferase [Bowmanella yangjiangensis]MBT1063389.1 molybdenum cofactor guanylyltransferase [Bowmanella yangjiangensis]
MLIGLVLAGGRSSRMGQDKALLEYHGHSLLQQAQQLLQKSGCERVLISRNQLGFVQDLVKDAGPLGGIHSALTQANNLDELLIVPVDMPFLRPSLLHDLYRYGRKNGRPYYFQHCFLPLYLPITEVLRNYLKQLMDNEGQGSVRHMLAHLQACALPCKAKHRLRNLNTPEQWQSAIAG